jgi:hypothetical protein
MFDFNGKQRFIYDEISILAWGASVQRANIYEKTSSKQDRDDFKKNIMIFIEKKILPKYVDPCTEEDHIANIAALADYGTEVGTKQGKYVLGESGYRIGIAQKLLNLQLKYLWCLGFIEEPPHCPVDRIVLSKTKLEGKLNWTQIKTKNEYIQAINAIRDVADSQKLSLSEWELKVFSRR